MCNTFNGIKFIVNSSDKTIGRGTYKSLRSFDSNILEQSLSILNSKKKILLDVGANIGNIGIYAVSNNYFEKCLAFEPEPRNFDLLKKNIFINDLSSKFEVFNLALDEFKKEEVVIKLSPDNYGDHRIHNKQIDFKENREEIIVQSDTLDNICKNLNLQETILFMDTQGFEGQILLGAKNLIKNKIPIITEFWPYGLKKSGGIEKFYEALKNSKYEHLYDLRLKRKRMPFSIKALKDIALELGDYEEIFTDLLIF